MTTDGTRARPLPRATILGGLPLPEMRPTKRIPLVFDRTAPGRLDEGVALVQKDARPGGFDLWAGVVVDDPSGVVPDPMPLTVRLRQLPLETAGEEVDERPVLLRWYRLGERPVSGVPGGARFFHGHLEVHGMAAGSYEVSVDVPWIAGTRGTAQAVARTLRGPLGWGDDSISVMVGSCYDIVANREDELDAAYRAVFGERRPPDLTFLLGDQVYADSPMTHYFLRSRRSPRSGLLLKYWATWGMSVTSGRNGLKELLRAGPNYFLPDDHEFWNNWPNQSVTAKHSDRSIGEAIKNGRARQEAALAEDDPAVVTIPPNPHIAPTCADQQSYLPVHPAEWQAWSLASFELFGSFQNRSIHDRETGQPSLGIDDEGAALRSAVPPGGPSLHQPRHPVLQTVTIDPVTFCLLDTRTRRTRSLLHRTRSAFVDPTILDEVIAQAEAAEVLVLATPQPLLTPATWTKRRRKRERFGLASLFSDTNMQDYPHQWQELWTRLIAARRGRPTVTLGGDIHQSYVAEATSLNLVEVVSSPMSLVWGGNVLRISEHLFGRVLGRKPLDYSIGHEFVDLSEVVAGPRDMEEQPSGGAVSRGCLRWNREGFAELTFVRSEPSALELRVVLYDRSAAKNGAGDGHVEARFCFAV